MSSKATMFLSFIILPLLWLSCAKETVDPETSGSIKGQVQNSKTGEPVEKASVTTTPGTEAVLTGPEGEFVFIDVPTGNYTIEVSKKGYITSTVRVAVNEDDTASAQILFEPDKEDKPPASEVIDASVENFQNYTTKNDSTYVQVNYLVKNKSKNTLVTFYEIYFKITTSGKTFFYEVQGDSLTPNEQDARDFTKLIRTLKAQKVTVSDIYFE